MKLEYTITQPFSANYNNSYLSSGLLGHPGVDYDGGYGVPVHSVFEQEYVYKVLTVNNPSNDGTGFTGVFTIVDNGIEVFEVLYGHGDPLVQVGQIVHKGDVIMTEANHGKVYQNGVQITPEMQQAGDKRGAHVHLQKRILRKDATVQPNTSYLTGLDGLMYCKDGFYFAIPFYKNGYSGCVNFLLPLLNSNLYLGCSGYDVGCLQRFLKARGFFSGDVTSYFGIITKQAVSAFQKANGISPTLGFVGSVTRNLINSILS